MLWRVRIRCQERAGSRTAPGSCLRGCPAPGPLHSPSFPLLSSGFGVFFPLLLLELPRFALCTLKHKKLFFVINSY